MDRCALFVDAGYLLADGAMAVHGTRHRESVSWDYPGLLRLLSDLASDRCGLPLLRCYWYDAAVEGRSTPDHDVLAELSGLKLRLGRTWPRRRTGVDAEVHRDLSTLAHNHAIADAVIVTAEEDLAHAITDVQDLGLRVTVVQVGLGGDGPAAASLLRQECDAFVELEAAHLRPYVRLRAGPEPARFPEAGPFPDQHTGAPYASAPVANGHPVASGHGAHHVPPVGRRHAASAIYPSPAVAHEREPRLQRPASAEAVGQQPFAEDPGAEGSRGLPGGGAAPGQAPLAGSERASQPGAAPPGHSEGAGSPGSSAGSRRAVAAGPAGPAAVAGPPNAAQPAAEFAAASGHSAQETHAAQENSAAPVGRQVNVAEALPGSEVLDVSGAFRAGTQVATAQSASAPAASEHLTPVSAHGRPPAAGYGAADTGEPLAQQVPGAAEAVGQRPVAGQAPPGGHLTHHELAARASSPSKPGQQATSVPASDVVSALGPQQHQAPQHQAQHQAPQHQAPQHQAPQQHEGLRQIEPQRQQEAPQRQDAPHDQPVQPPLYAAPTAPPLAPHPATVAATPSGQEAHRGVPASGQVAGPSAPGMPPGGTTFSGHPGTSSAPYLPPQAPYSGPQPVPPPAPVPAPTTTLAEATAAAHAEGLEYGESVAREAPALWLEAVLARKPRMPSDLEARLLQGSSLPIDFLLHDEVRHALRRGFWDALERARR